jgi:hypothetical protein
LKERTNTVPKEISNHEKMEKNEEIGKEEREQHTEPRKGN